MQAMVIEHYGPSKNFHWAEIPTPKPKSEEVLIKVHATSINPLDWRLRSGSLKYLLPLRFPLILGFDFCGKIAEVGKNVKHWKKGQWVFGISNHLSGQCYAQYLAIHEKYLVEKPETVSIEEAAAMPVSASTALIALKNAAQIEQGKTVLINGASGGVGHFAVQIARYFGAKVTAVCSQKNDHFVKSLGADKIIHYETNPVLTESYDIIFDVVGNLRPQDVWKALNARGVGLSIVPSLSRLTFQPLTYLSNRHYKNIFVHPDQKVLSFLASMAKEKTLIPFIQESIPLAQIQRAHDLIEAKHVKGKLTILVE